MPLVLYVSPNSLEEALPLVAQHPDGIMAGGTVWMPLLHNRLTKTPPTVVDVTKISELLGIEEHDGSIRIGAAVTLSELEDSSSLPSILREAARSTASPEIRNHATVGGNIDTALVPGDLLPALWVLDAEVELQGPHAAVRRVPVSSYITSVGSIRDPGELIVSLNVHPAPGHRYYYRKVGRRAAFSQPQVTLALRSLVQEDGVISELEVVVGAITRPPVRVDQIDSVALGQVASQELAAECASSAGPISDVDSEYWTTSEYRTTLVRAMIEEGLNTIWAIR